MEILEHGKYFKDDTCICRNCDCVFRYEPNDLVRLQYIDEDIRTLVICHECKERNYLD
jgi:hypothetical protein